jgi:hypothetical protein
MLIEVSILVVHLIFTMPLLLLMAWQKVQCHLTWVRLPGPMAFAPLVYIREKPMRIKAQEASED